MTVVLKELCLKGANEVKRFRLVAMVSETSKNTFTETKSFKVFRLASLEYVRFDYSTNSFLYETESLHQDLHSTSLLMSGSELRCNGRKQVEHEAHEYAVNVPALHAKLRLIDSCGFPTMIFCTHVTGPTI